MEPTDAVGREGRPLVVPGMIMSARNSGLTGTAHTTTEFFGLSGIHNADATETNREYLVPDSFRATKIILRVSQNNTDGASTFTLRKNGADTGLSISVGANTTGAFTATGEVLLSEGDNIALEATTGTGATGDTITFESWSVVFEPRA